MPRRSWRPCAEPGCPELVDGKARCPDHQLPDRRPQMQHRGYGQAWRRIRRAFIEANPTCVGWPDPCGQPADTADHVVPRRVLIARGDPDPDGHHHLQPLCRVCHLRKTAAGL